jgi:hypothetical protein
VTADIFQFSPFNLVAGVSHPCHPLSARTTPAAKYSTPATAKRTVLSRQIRDNKKAATIYCNERYITQASDVDRNQPVQLQERTALGR